MTHYLIDEIQGTGDKEGLFTGNGYQKRSKTSLVVADGAHVVDVTGGKAVDVDKLVSYIQSEDGPGVLSITEESHEWHWADSEGSEEALVGLGVREHFKLHLYKSIDGRQCGAVDAKVQSLVRRFFLKARKAGVRSASLVLLASDGDHAVNLWEGILGMLRCRIRVTLWVIGWDAASVSHKLRIPPAEVRSCEHYKKYLKVECRYFSKKGFCEIRSISLTDRRIDGIPPQLPTLYGFVSMIFPRVDCPLYEALLRNPGLHKLVAATWDALDVTGQEVTYQNRVMVVSGKTGSGKSTQLPQIMYDMLCFKRYGKAVNGVPFQRPRVLCTQPRRIACTRIAEFVKTERGSRRFPWDENPREVVGYHIGGVREVYDGSGVVYCTAGVLLKQLLHGKDKHWDVVMLDEIHERTVEYDLLLALLLDKDFLNSGKLIIIMSATLGGIAQDFLEYAIRRCSWFDKNCFSPYDITGDADEVGCSHPAFQDYPPLARTTKFTVEEFFLEDIIDQTATHSDRRQVLAKSVWPREREKCVKSFLIKTLRRSVTDTILVFCPGVGLIYDFQKFIESRKIPGVRLSVLFSKLTDEEQADAITRRDTDKIRVILSTDLAESSLTIEDVTIVVDLCLRKEAQSVGRSHKQLDYTRTPRDTCIQRRGRVGRVQDGQCYYMISREEWATIAPSRTPEIVRQNLELIVLNVLSKSSPTGGSGSASNPLQLISNCLTAPKIEKIDAAVLELQRICALSPPKTPGGVPHLETFGSMLHHMPCDVDVARFIIWCSLVDHKLGKLAVIYAAMLESGALNDSVGLPDDLQTVWDTICIRARLRHQAADGFPSDVIVLIRTFLDYSRKTAGPFTKQDAVDRWCRRRGLDGKTMAGVKRRIAQMRHELHKYRPLMPELPMGLMSQSGQLLKLGEVLGSLEKENLEMDKMDSIMLMVLHAGCFAANAVRCYPVDTKNLPRRAIEVKMVSKDATRSDQDRLYADKKRVLSMIFQSRGSPVAGDVHLLPPSDDKWKSVTATIKIFKLGRGEDNFPLSLYLASQIDSRGVKNMFTDNTSIYITVPHYSYELEPTPNGERRESRNLLQTTMLKPLILPEGSGSGLYVFPTDVEYHESITERNRYVRMNSHVTALPDVIQTEGGTKLWEVILYGFGEGSGVEDVLLPHIEKLQNGLSRMQIVNSDAYLCQVEQSIDDSFLDDAADDVVPQKMRRSCHTVVHSGGTVSNELKRTLEVLLFRFAPSSDRLTEMFRVIA